MIRQLFILFSLPIICFGQEDNSHFFMQQCNGAFDNNMNHFENLDSKPFCDCFIEKVYRKFTLEEINVIVTSAKENSKNFAEGGYILYQNKELLKLYKECFNNQKLSKESYIQLTEEKLSAFISQCKDETKLSLTPKEMNEFLQVVNFDSYCECFVKKYTSSFTISELNDIPKYPNSNNAMKLSKMAEDCVSENVY